MIRNYLKDNFVDLSDSAVFGDTEHDIPMLEKVGMPIALNPNDALLKTAKEKGWTVLTEENNVIRAI